ncbi:hypothetical protein BJP36_37405 [Moorena producens JHB]|uniref:Uncharacterized protein n=1 Tax=Moorena producens (strain JHB) TaxID=1454205 RepID=A0A9Q9SUC2_MOOP1|nr:hypothetical protein [Moorena producens]WAN69773.1 hypothetical protein BJP36_37405 [Moorena producens JHB]
MVLKIFDNTSYQPSAVSRQLSAVGGRPRYLRCCQPSAVSRWR